MEQQTSTAVPANLAADASSNGDNPVPDVTTELQQQHANEIENILQDRNTRIEALMAEHKETLDRFKHQAKDRDRKQSEKIRQITAEKDAVAFELDRVKKEHLVALEKQKNEITAKLRTEARELQRRLAPPVVVSYNGNQQTLEKLRKVTAEKDAALEKLKNTSLAPNALDVSKVTITRNQAIEFFENNDTLQNIAAIAVKESVDEQTEKLTATIAAKDAELQAAKQEKEDAVKRTMETAQREMKVRLNTRDMMQAKIAVVKKAVQETPEKPVKDVWELADKARPAQVSSTGPTAPPAVSSPAAPTHAAAQPKEHGTATNVDARPPSSRTVATHGSSTLGQPSYQMTSDTLMSSNPSLPQITKESSLSSSAGSVRKHDTIAESSSAEQPPKRMKLDFLHPLQIIVGFQGQTFQVPRNMILSRSKYIKNAAERHGDKIALLDAAPQIFSIYLQCVYSNTVVVDDETSPAEDGWDLLVKTYVLADKVGDPISTNLIMDEIIRRLSSSTSHAKLASTIKTVFERTSQGSLLRKVFIDYVVHRNQDRALFQECQEAGVVEFLVELGKAFTDWREKRGVGGIALVGRHEFATNWMDYHVQQTAAVKEEKDA